MRDYLAAALLPILVMAVVTPLLTRLLGAAGYGHWAVALSITQVAQVVVTLGLPSAITRHVTMAASGREGASGIASRLAQVLVAAALVLWGLALGLAPDSGRLTTLALASACAIGAFLGQQAVSVGSGESTVFLRRAALFYVVPNALAVPPMFVVSSPDLYLSILSLAQIALAAASSRSRARIAPAREVLTDVRIGIATVPHQIAIISASAGIVWLVSRLDGPEVAGAVQLGIFIGMLPALLIGAMNNAWARGVYRRPPEDRIPYLMRSTAIVMQVACVAVVWGVALAPYGAVLMTADVESRAVVEATIVVVVLAAPLFVLYLSNIHLVFASGRTGLLAVTTPVSATICLVGLATYHAWARSPDPSVYGLALVGFYLLQMVFSYALRRKVDGRALPLRNAVTWATATFVSVGVVRAAGGDGPLAIGAALLLTAFALAGLRHGLPFATSHRS